MLRGMVVLILVATAGCGDDSGAKCGDGTHLVGGSCVPVSTIACGSGTTEVDGECVADVVPDDVTPPGPVTGLSASESGGTVTLSWTNPTDADFESVLVVRRGSLQVTAAPSRGVAYPDGATMTDGSLVVTTATGTSAMDATAAKGVAFYAVYARDKTGNWSAGTHVRALLPLPAQNATISITLQDGPVATVTQQPANFHLEAQARSGVRLQVRITSLVERPVFNTKIVVTSINNGTVAGNGFIGTNAYAQTAIGALWPGATRDAEDLIITEDGTVDPIVLQVQVVDDPLFIGTQIYATGSPFNFVDSRTYVGRGITCATALVPGGTPNGFCSLTSGVLSADARRLTMGMRNLPRLVTFETSSFRVVGGVDLASGLGSIAALAADASGATLYAVLNTGQHGAFGSMSPVGGRHDGDIALVKLDAATLQETARLVLRMSPNGAAQPYGKDLALSPDGKYAAIPIAGAQEVYVVDLATFTVVDTDSTMASTQPIDVTAISQGASPRSVVFTADSSKLLIGYSPARGHSDNDGTITSVNTTTWAKTSIAPSPAVADGGRVAKMVRAPDNSIWVLRNENSGLSVFSSDLSTETRVDTRPAAAGSPQQIAFTPDGARAFVAVGLSSLAVFNVSTRTREDLDGVAGAPISNATLPNIGVHWALFTPF